MARIRAGGDLIAASRPALDIQISADRRPGEKKSPLSVNSAWFSVNLFRTIGGTSIRQPLLILTPEDIMLRKIVIAAAVLLSLTSMGLVENAHAGRFDISGNYVPTCHYHYDWRICH